MLEAGDSTPVGKTRFLLTMSDDSMFRFVYTSPRMFSIPYNPSTKNNALINNKRLLGVYNTAGVASLQFPAHFLSRR